MNHWKDRDKVRITEQEGKRLAVYPEMSFDVATREITFTGRHAGAVMRAVEDELHPEEWQMACDPIIEDEGGVFSITYVFWNP